MANLKSSHGISIDLPGLGEWESHRPSNIRHVSSPAYGSPLRHHRRKASTPHHVKETLHARSEYTNSGDDGAAVLRINQYVIKQEIGRGSFGAVHLAVDQHGNEYAVKEFSKSRLRKRAQSNVLRRPHGPARPGHLAAGLGFNAPLSRRSKSEQGEGGNSLYLIREEIAIMKKLNHNNLVSLIEVLDDPNEDSLYMVLEMCKKGVIMKVGVNEKADPYDNESCRCWFRDLILGIEYLHAQGVVHRDIKPDNLLLTDDDILKVVDFGVSEMFEKASDMRTTKSAGSPAFLPPELCVSRHGDISGKAVDVWSMGITLYCLYFGTIPFEKTSVLDLYQSIKHDVVDLKDCLDRDFIDLMHRILEKDPSKRITIAELRDHSWVTKGGTDPLLSADENTADLIEPPTEEEMNKAITGNLSNLLVVMKAVKKFKSLLVKRRPELMDGILGRDARIVQPPLAMSPSSPSSVRPRAHQTHSLDTYDRRPIEQALVVEGVTRNVDSDIMDRPHMPPRLDTSIVTEPPTKKRSIGTPSDQQAQKDPTSPSTLQGHGKTVQSFSPTTSPKRDLDADPKAHRSFTAPHTNESPAHYAAQHHKGHAHNPLDEHLFLYVGPGPDATDSPPDPPAVSESPHAAEMNIYETAYHDEIERIRQNKGRAQTLYLTRRVDDKDENLVGREKSPDRGAGGLRGLLRRVREREGTESEKGKGKETEKEGEVEGKDKVTGTGNGAGEKSGADGSKASKIDGWKASAGGLLEHLKAAKGKGGGGDKEGGNGNADGEAPASKPAE